MVLPIRLVNPSQSSDLYSQTLRRRQRAPGVFALDIYICMGTLGPDRFITRRTVPGTGTTKLVVNSNVRRLTGNIGYGPSRQGLVSCRSIPSSECIRLSLLPNHYNSPRLAWALSQKAQLSRLLRANLEDIVSSQALVYVEDGVTRVEKPMRVVHISHCAFTDSLVKAANEIFPTITQVLPMNMA